MRLALAAIPILLIGGCVTRSHFWWRGAERAVAEAVRATAQGTSAPDVDVSLSELTSDATRWHPRADFRQSYEVTGADSYLLGTSPLDLVDPAAAAWVAHLRFSGGHVWHAEAWRGDGGRWQVRLAPAEGQ